MKDAKSVRSVRPFLAGFRHVARRKVDRSTSSSPSASARHRRER